MMDAAAFVEMDQSLTLCVFALLLLQFILFSLSTKKVAKEPSLLLSPCCLFRHHFLPWPDHLEKNKKSWAWLKGTFRNQFCMMIFTSIWACCRAKVMLNTSRSFSRFWQKQSPVIRLKSTWTSLCFRAPQPLFLSRLPRLLSHVFLHVPVPESVALCPGSLCSGWQVWTYTQSCRPSDFVCVVWCWTRTTCDWRVWCGHPWFHWRHNATFQTSTHTVSKYWSKSDLKVNLLWATLKQLWLRLQD